MRMGICYPNLRFEKTGRRVSTVSPAVRSHAAMQYLQFVVQFIWLRMAHIPRTMET